MKQTLSIKNLFEKKIKKVFQNPKYSEIPFISNGFYFNDLVHTDSLLFIGLNPSLRKKDTVTENMFYQLDYSQTGDNHFTKMLQIAKDNELDWSFIDILQCRETNQKNVESLLNSELGRSFIEEQLRLTTEIIISIKPKLIIVTNAFARKLIVEYKNLFFGELLFDRQIGTYKITENELVKNVPIVFSGMLSGQRALDIGSFERLNWQIGFIKSQI